MIMEPENDGSVFKPFPFYDYHSPIRCPKTSACSIEDDESNVFTAIKFSNFL